MGEKLIQMKNLLIISYIILKIFSEEKSPEPLRGRVG